ncbi:hypothetical protein N5O88_05375 [Pseudomonas sp. GD03721]|nr:MULTISPECIES: hypothetical protein [unclassified Pseudomonas]MDH1442035.1 hypothetical protein [Pseudomonas sp. GD03722]WGG02675.1 hypothetical protein N5O88_05375 [Pseudomonas sp. GD03721]WGG06843.1 hypothetical protein N5O87_05385 [Pseudomonas sp. GD03919]
MNFTLPEEGLQRLTAQLNLTGTFTHTLRSTYGGHQLMARVRIERGQPNTAVRIEMGDQVHTLDVQTAHPEKHLQVADFIDAIANGRVDGGELAPPRVTRQPVLPEPAALLDETQLGRLKHMVRHGGFTSLETGHEHPIHVAVHRTRPAEGVTIIASIGAARPRTKCFTVRGDQHECLKRLLISIEHLHIIATPQRAAAA